MSRTVIISTSLDENLERKFGTAAGQVRDMIRGEIADKFARATWDELDRRCTGPNRLTETLEEYKVPLHAPTGQVGVSNVIYWVTVRVYNRDTEGETVTIGGGVDIEMNRSGGYGNAPFVAPESIWIENWESVTPDGMSEHH